jgi:hypothetical protein
VRRSRARRTIGVLTLAALAAMTAGCSSDEKGSGYCDAVAQEKKTFTELAAKGSEPGTDLVNPALAAYERLRAEAPQSLSDEYDTVVFAYRALADAVKEDGVDPGDYRPGARPPGVTAAEAHELAGLAAELASPRVLDAVQGIEDHADQVCHVDLAG